MKYLLMAMLVGLVAPPVVFFYLHLATGYLTWCPEGQIELSVLGKGVFCVQATKWKGE